MTNVIHMPTQADKIAETIREDIEAMKRAESDWRDHAVSLCEQVAAAKALYPRTKEFGAWWDAQGFDMDAPTRAALVAMGNDIERARKVFEATESRSLRLVYQNDFRLNNDVKSEKPKEKSAAKSEPRKLSKLSTVAEQIIADIDAIGGGEDDIPTCGEIARKYTDGDVKVCEREGGFINAQVRSVLRDRASRIDGPEVDVSTLPPDWQAKYERALKTALKKMQDGFYQAVKDEVAKFVDSAHPDWKRKIEFAEKYASGRRQEQFPFNRKQYRELLFFTHPDRAADDMKERANAIFMAVKEKQDSLVMPEPPVGGPAFPETSEELRKNRK